MAWEDDDPEETAGSISRVFAANDEGEAPDDEPPVEGADSSPAPTAGPQEQNNDDGTDYLSAPGEQLPPEQQGPVQDDDEQVYASSGPNELDTLAQQGPADAAIGTSVGTGGMRSAPIAPTAPNLEAVDYSQLEHDMQPLNREDYKPSVGRRIQAALVGGLEGASGNRNAVQDAQNVKNRAYNNAVSDQGRRVAADQTGIQAAQGRNATTQQNFGNQNTQFREQESQMNDEALQAQRAQRAEDYAAQAAGRRNAITQFTPNDPNNPYGGGTGVTADGRTQKNVAPPDNWLAKWEKSPQGQAAISSMSTTQRSKAADVAHLQGEQRAQFIATGKVSPTPRTSIHIPSAQLQEYEDKKSAFAKENGRQPNLAELEAIQQVHSGGMSKPLGDKIEAQKNTAFAQAKQVFQGTPDKGTAAEGYRSDLQDAQDAYEQRIENATGQPVPHVTVAVDKNGNVNWGGAQQSQQPAPQGAGPAAQQQAPQTFTYKGQSFQSGQPVMVDGRPAVVTGFNAQTGKLITKAQ